MTVNQTKLNAIQDLVEQRIIALDNTQNKALRGLEVINSTVKQNHEDTLSLMIASFASAFLYRILFISHRGDFKATETAIRYHSFSLGKNIDPNDDSDRSVAMQVTKSILDEIITTILEPTEEAHLIESNQ